MTSPDVNHPLARFPAEIRALPNWCIAAPDKSPYSVGGHRASVTYPHGWAPFEVALERAQAWGYGAGVGFVLSPGCGFVCIDLDVKEDTPPGDVAAIQERHQKIIEVFDTYTERSRSGRGYHLWLYGSIGAGRRRDGVEVYSQDRFIICTGDVVRDRPLRRADEMLALLLSEMGDAGEAPNVLEESGETEPDDVIWKRACEAENADKFKELCNGNWWDLGCYPSQSEADLALLSIFAFYTRSNAQVRRMFRLTELGKREKAIKNDDYLNRTLRQIRGRQAREEARSVEEGKVAAALADVLMAAQQNRMAPVQGAAPAPETAPVGVTVPAAVKNEAVEDSRLPYPPGFIGAVAEWLYSVAPRPVREIAIVSALGLFAGLFGRELQVNKSGTNLYLVLVAQSGVGKEALHTSISKLINHLDGNPDLVNHIDFNEYASGPALIKSFGDVKSVVNIAGEWGRKLKAIGRDDVGGPMASLRTVMTNLYQKSGMGTIVGGIGYSDTEKNIKSLDGIAYSMVGETTPDTFYESLTNSMMQDGFLSRFIVVEYTGERTELNEVQDMPMAVPFLKHFEEVLKLAAGKLGVKEARFVPESAQMLDDFDKECDRQINDTREESWRQMWNRAHLKALKISALLGAARSPWDPVVEVEDAAWAIGLVRRDISTMSRKIREGDVGDGDESRERKVLSVLREYLQRPIPPGYKLPDSMRGMGIVARKFIQIRTHRVNSFLTHRLGGANALDSTLKSLVDSGYLAELPKSSTPPDWVGVGKCYRIVTLPDA